MTNETAEIISNAGYFYLFHDVVGVVASPPGQWECSMHPHTDAKHSYYAVAPTIDEAVAVAWRLSICDHK